MGLTNLTVDACKYLNNRMSSTILDIAIKDLRKYSNIIHPCPHKVIGNINSYNFCACDHWYSVSEWKYAGIDRTSIFLYWLYI